MSNPRPLGRPHFEVGSPTIGLRTKAPTQGRVVKLCRQMRGWEQVFKSKRGHRVQLNCACRRTNYNADREPISRCIKNVSRVWARAQQRISGNLRLRTTRYSNTEKRGLLQSKPFPVFLFSFTNEKRNCRPFFMIYFSSSRRTVNLCFVLFSYLNFV